MWNSIVRHIKLIEGVGLLLGLTGAVLEWRWVSPAGEVPTKWHASIMSIQDAYSQAHSTRVVEFEAAVTRAIATTHDHKDEGPLRNYATAWKSSEVRHQWLRRIEGDMLQNTTFIEQLKYIEDEYGLPHNQRINDLSSRLQDIKTAIAASLDQNPPNTAAPTPDPMKIRGRDAGVLDRRVGQIHSEIGDVLTSTRKALDDRASLRSTIHQCLVVVGALLFVFTRIVEWKVGVRITS